MSRRNWLNVVLELDLMNVVAGTRFRGDGRAMNNIINDRVTEEDGHVIPSSLTVLHTIMGLVDLTPL